MEAKAAPRIRQAVESDAQAIARVIVDSWRTTYAGIVPAAHLAGLDYDQRAARWRNLIADRRQITYVALDREDRAVGFVSGGPERTGRSVDPSVEDGDPSHGGELYAIYLLRSGQRQGLGRRLVGALCAWFLRQGAQTMLTWVLAENPARRFYAALGGTELRRQTITIGGKELVEIAYGWNDISPLATAIP